MRLRPLHNVSIKHKINFVVMLKATVAALIALAAFVIHDSVTARQKMARDLMIITDTVANNSSAASLELLASRRDFSDTASLLALLERYSQEASELLVTMIEEKICA